jgi:nicotinate-nucleotide adenylyltransferase
MRTGILGGSFDPVHMGHLIISETVKSDFPLDRVVLVPAALSPLKNASGASPEDRLHMARIASSTSDQIGVLDCDVKRGGLSYTVDTLRWFKSSEIYGEDELFFIMGSDGLADWDRWKDKDEILELSRFLVVMRPGYPFEPDAGSHGRMIPVNAPLIGVSSREIRERIRSGLSIRHWVPDPVEAWIRTQGLYRS